MDLSLRPAVAEDDAFSLKVYASTRVQEMEIVPWSEEQKQAFLEQQFNAQRSSYLLHRPAAEWLIILRDDEPIGRMIIDRSSSTIELMDIGLLPEFRNAGIGSSFINDLLNESRETGKPVALYVEQYNPAFNLYSRMGFTVTGEEGVYFYMRWTPSGQVAT